jgi:hypothetical protein
MKISKDENGKLIIDGENRTILFPLPGECGINVEGFGEDAVSTVSNIVFFNSKSGGVDEMARVLNYLASLSRINN